MAPGPLPAAGAGTYLSTTPGRLAAASYVVKSSGSVSGSVTALVCGDCHVTFTLQ